MKRCVTCHDVKPETAFHKNKAKSDGLHNQCKSCRKRYYASNRGNILKYNRAWNARNSDRIARHNRARSLSIPGRARQLWHGARLRAQANELSFDLRLEWVIEALRSGDCQRTGIAFDFATNDYRRTNPWAPSIDKINPFGDYTISNVQIVCWAYNVAKHQMTDDEFLAFCRQIVSFNS